MTRLAFTAPLATGCGRTPTAPASPRAPAAAVHDGYLGSGNRTDTTTTRP